MVRTLIKEVKTLFKNNRNSTSFLAQISNTYRLLYKKYEGNNGQDLLRKQVK